MSTVVLNREEYQMSPYAAYFSHAPMFSGCTKRLFLAGAQNMSHEETRTYVMKSPLLFFRDVPQYDREKALQGLRFHIEVDDYFSTLATLLGFVQEKLSTLEHTEDVSGAPSLEQNVLAEIKKDLLYLQEHYSIGPKIQK